MNIADPVNVLDGVGPKVAALLKRLGIKTIQDLLLHFPRDYNDYSEVTQIASLKPGEVTVLGTVENVRGRYVRRGLHITEAVIADETSKIKAVWFNQPYLEKSLPRGKEIYFSGTYELAAKNLSLQNPAWELKSEFTKNTARIVPIYKETKGLTSKQLRRYIAASLECVGQFSKGIAGPC